MNLIEYKVAIEKSSDISNNTKMFRDKCQEKSLSKSHKVCSPWLVSCRSETSSFSSAERRGSKVIWGTGTIG